jgi:DNA processing protein
MSLPSTDADPELLAAVRLNLIPGIGPRTQQTLLTRFGTAAAVFAASRHDLLSLDGIGPKLTHAIQRARENSAAEIEWERCRKLGIDLRVRGRDNYPPSLLNICDPPGVLSCRGTLEPRDDLAVAIVGSRRCTLYGRQQAEKLAGGLARAGVTIISGLARGIDGSAHQGALAAGGRTIAVLGTGLANIYPPEHVELAERVARQGAVVSEMPLDQAPVPGLFPQRNRIISGLSLAVIVIEASRNSGALHTVRHALEQGRDVLAVPGRIDSLASEGCHDMIRDGATLIRNVDDVLQALGPLAAPISLPGEEQLRSPRELSLDPQERIILNLVSVDPLHVDEILRTAGLEPSRVLATLTVLEMKRFIRRLPGGHFCRE